MGFGYSFHWGQAGEYLQEGPPEEASGPHSMSKSKFSSVVVSLCSSWPINIVLLEVGAWSQYCCRESRARLLPFAGFRTKEEAPICFPSEPML